MREHFYLPVTSNIAKAKPLLQLGCFTTTLRGLAFNLGQERKAEIGLLVHAHTHTHTSTRTNLQVCLHGSGNEADTTQQTTPKLQQVSTLKLGICVCLLLGRHAKFWGRRLTRALLPQRLISAFHIHGHRHARSIYVEVRNNKIPATFAVLKMDIC